MAITLEKKIGAGFVLTIVINLLAVGALWGTFTERVETQGLAILKHDNRILKIETTQFTGDNATILRSQAVAEAVAISTRQNEKIAAEMKIQTSQINEMKLMLADLIATQRANKSYENRN